MEKARPRWRAACRSRPRRSRPPTCTCAWPPWPCCSSCSSPSSRRASILARGGLIIENIMTYSTIRPHLPRAALAGARPACLHRLGRSGTSPTESTDDAAVVADHTVVAPQVSGFIRSAGGRQPERRRRPAAGPHRRPRIRGRPGRGPRRRRGLGPARQRQRHAGTPSGGDQPALAVTRADAADLRFAESEVQRHRNRRARAPARARPMSRPAAAWT